MHVMNCGYNVSYIVIDNDARSSYNLFTVNVDMYRQRCVRYDRARTTERVKIAHTKHHYDSNFILQKRKRTLVLSHYLITHRIFKSHIVVTLSAAASDPFNANPLDLDLITELHNSTGCSKPR